MSHFGDQMQVPLMGLLAAPQIDFPGGEVAVLMVLRWIHLMVGIAYWMHIVASDARYASVAGEPVSPGMMFGSFFVLWTLAFAIEMGVLMSPAKGLRKGPVLGVIVAIAVMGASYAFLALNHNGWESNRGLAIGIGGGLGWFMLLNVWGIIWRMQKKMIRWTEANATQGTAMPPESAKVARLTMLCARVNFVLSFPMLFFMGAASHYAMFLGK